MASKITLITGGSRSGKSTYAENMYKGNDDVLYIATAIVTDSEMEQRINTHRMNRNQKWETAEQFKGVCQVVASTSKKDIILDCVTVMVTNLMFDQDAHAEDLKEEEVQALEERIIQEFENLIGQARDQDKNLVLVTNEVGYGLVPEYRLGRIFSDIAGRVNQRIAALSDEVFLIACGLPMQLK